MSSWVVCGVSVDADSCEAVHRAAALAERTGARLAIVAVIPDPGDGDDRRRALAAARFAVADVARRCGVTDDAVHHVEVGDPSTALARVADGFAARSVVVSA